MEIKKFEAYNYRGPALKDLTRAKFIEELTDIFTDQKLFGYVVNGSTYYPKEEVLWLHVDKEENGKYTDSKIIKLDLSDLGIEIGAAEWSDDDEEFGEFQIEVNLDTDTIRQIKTYKKDITKYNV